MEKLSPNRAQLFLRNKCTILTIGGTVSTIFFSGELPKEDIDTIIHVHRFRSNGRG